MTRVVNDIDCPNLPIEEEPGFDAEVETLLRPGNAELLRGVRPRTLRAMGLAPPRATGSPRFRYGAVAAVAAIAAAVSFVLVRPAGEEAPTGELAPVFYGELETSRGARAEKRERVYGRDGTLHVELSQSRAAGRVPAGILRVFEVDRERHLRELSVQVFRQDDDASIVVFSFKTKVSSLFGDAPSGKKTLAFVVGGFSSDLSELDGTELSSVQARRDLRCFVEEIAIAETSAF
jgi:hypothetical protein